MHGCGLARRIEQVSGDTIVLDQGTIYPVLLGCGTGLAFAFVVLRWIRSLLFQTPVIDPLAIGGSACLIATFAAQATFIPARRAASIDPMQAFRME